MTHVAVAEIPRGRPFTVDDLAEMPDDGNRYELIDGVLIVSPAPTFPHQFAVGELFVILRGACPPDLNVLMAPFAVRPDGFNELQPDLLVFRAADVLVSHLPVGPLLAVEVLSPNTQLFDRNTKASAFARMGTPRYWLVDPDEPAVTVLELTRGRYQQVAHVVGDEVLTQRVPFPVRLRPAELVRPG